MTRPGVLAERTWEAVRALNCRCADEPSTAAVSRDVTRSHETLAASDTHTHHSLTDTLHYWSRSASIKGLRWWMKKRSGQATAYVCCFVFPSVLWHLIAGWQEGHLACKISHSTNPQTVSSRKGGGGPQVEPVDPGSSGKTAVKWK